MNPMMPTPSAIKNAIDLCRPPTTILLDYRLRIRPANDGLVCCIKLGRKAGVIIF
jgi:hypothetical protein